MRAISLLLALLLAPTVLAQSFEWLGDLPGGSTFGFYSYASGVSGDGTVVVGSSDGANGEEAFRWTAEGGMVGLGALPGPIFCCFISTAADVSEDGFVVAGQSGFSSSGRAFRWTEAGGMEDLGVLPGGSSSAAGGISGDGSTVIGRGRGADGDEAFRWTAESGMVGLGALPGDPNYTTQPLDVSADGSVVVGRAGEFGDKAFRWTEADGMVALGALPGRPQSWASGVSSNGSIVVGGSSNDDGPEAFRWTAEDGMVGLGFLPGMEKSEACCISGDGNVILGASYGAAGVDLFIWTAESGMQSLTALLGVNPELITSLSDVSYDGTVVVGGGVNPDGNTEAWRAVVQPSIAVDVPAADSLVTGGEPLTIRWTRSDDALSVDVVLLPDTLGAAEVTLSAALDADSLAWLVPNTLFSRSARIAVVSSTDSTMSDTTEAFRIKPYHLARLSEDGARYVPFSPARHGWKVTNAARFWFPSSWWSQEQFDYQNGEDPFTDDAYPVLFSSPPVTSVPPVFPDWPAYVRAFGTDEAFHTLNFFDATYDESFLAQWERDHGGDRWGGSCYGMAASALLAFTHRLDFEASYPGLGPVEELVTVDTSAAAREVVNTLYTYQHGRAAIAEDDVHYFGTTLTTPNQTLEQLKALLAPDDDPNDQRILALFDVRSCAPRRSRGGHAVTPYRVARRSLTSNVWDVFIYDPNLPRDTTAAIAIDTASNTWSYGGLTWGGACGLYLMDPILNYLDPATLPSSSRAARLAGPAGARAGTRALYVTASPRADVALVGAGGRIGHTAGEPFNTIPEAVPVVPKVGGPALPIGYHVPDGAYDLTLEAPVDSALSATFAFDGRNTSYGRADAAPAQTDHLAYNPDAFGGTGEIVLRSDDSGTKTVVLRTILTDDPAERTLDVQALTLTGPDSVRLSVPDGSEGPTLHLVNVGGPKTYTIRLREASATGEATFRHAAIGLPAGATHTARPNWATLGEGPVEVDVDTDGDGIPDDVLVLSNDVPVATESGSGEDLALSLSPNPTRGALAVRFGVREAGPVRLAVYDALGREVAILSDGPRQSGEHEAVFDGSGLSAGVYLVRLEAEGSVQTRPVTVVR